MCIFFWFCVCVCVWGGGGGGGGGGAFGDENIKYQNIMNMRKNKLENKIDTVLKI